MELPANLVRWMAAFLVDREQRVKIGDAVSRPGYPNGGVPQGTVPGPKHFLVHIIYIRTPCPIYKYVDDSTIFEIYNQSRVSVIQDSANIIAQWSSDNDMRINTSKTKEMVICFCKDRTYVESLPYIDINGTDIERVTQDLTRFNKICHPSQRPRWQVDKEAIGLSRVQQCSSTYSPPS